MVGYIACSAFEKQVINKITLNGFTQYYINCVKMASNDTKVRPEVVAESFHTNNRVLFSTIYSAVETAFSRNKQLSGCIDNGIWKCSIMIKNQHRNLKLNANRALLLMLISIFLHYYILSTART